MNLSAFDQAAWALHFAAHLAAIAFILWRRAAGRFPFLMSVLLFETLQTVVLFCLRDPAHYTVYFYAYWTAAVVRALLWLAVVIDVVRSISGIQYAPRRLMTAMVTVSLVIAMGSGYLSMGAEASVPQVAIFALALDRCVAVIWASFGLSLFASVGALGLAWTDTSLRVAAGFFAKAMLGILSAYAILEFLPSYQTSNSVETAIMAADWVFLGWAVSTKTGSHPALTKEESELILQVLKQHAQ